MNKGELSAMKKAIAIIMVLALSVGLTGIVSAAYDTKKATAIKATPVVDGVIDDIWASAVEVDANLVNQTLIPSQTTTTAKVKFAWDEKYLYTLAVVTDSAVWPTASVGTASEDKDSIEYGVDEKNTKGVDNVNAGNANAGVFRVGTNDSEISGFGDWFTAKSSEVKGKTVLTDTGYIAEMAIPWNTLTPAEGTVISLEVQIDDNDLGEKRTGLVTWNSDACLGWKDSESHGEITLAAAPAPAATEAPAATDTTTTAPQTGDTAVYAVILTAISAAALVVLKKSRVK